ncbi:MAG: MazG family protein [Actinomycetota bacterium]
MPETQSNVSLDDTEATTQLAIVMRSPRVAPGLLTREAWRAVELADQVWCMDPTSPEIAPLLTETAAVSMTPAPGATMAEIATTLLHAAAAHRVLWIGSLDGDPGLTDALAAELSRVALAGPPPAVEVVVGSHDMPGARLLDVVTVMDQLRSPGGCPWDAEQTHESLVRHLLEEAYEAAEALESGDREHIREELGDVLLQVAFHARIATEDEHDPFDIDDVAAGIVAKLIRRHPHIFTAPGVEVAQPPADGADVQQQWDQLKAAERQGKGPFAGIPHALPALARAQKILDRAHRLPAEQLPAHWNDSTGDEAGDALVRAVRRCRELGVDAESVLRQAIRVIEGRFSGGVS